MLGAHCACRSEVTVKSFASWSHAPVEWKFLFLGGAAPPEGEGIRISMNLEFSYTHGDISHHSFANYFNQDWLTSGGQSVSESEN